MHYESTKETESPLRKIRLYKKVSDGYCFRWGKTQRNMETESLQVLPTRAEVIMDKSESSDCTFTMPEESFENIDECVSVQDSRLLIKKNFSTDYFRTYSKK